MHIGEDPPEKLQLTPLERTLLESLAGQLGDAGVLLRAQVASAVVTARSHSGVGFVTRLRVSGAPALPGHAVQRASLLRAEHPHLSGPAEFCLQFRNGLLATIEAWCQQGVWPADESLFRFGALRRH